VTAPRRRLKVGLIGLGRLGKIYARDLATRIPETRLVAVSDPDGTALGEVAALYEVGHAHADPAKLLDDSEVEAVVIASPTHTHAALSVAAAGTGKAIFCEKPPALSLAETDRMKAAVSKPGVFFQMGFMRRFDPGYAAAKKKIQEGLIGTPVVFKSSSRDPHRTTLEYANPKSSGGMIMDMGIHDFDLARFFMGDVKSVTAVGGTLAYPELKTVGDIDNAIVSLVFADDHLGVVDLSRNGIYGYDISTEILGTAGTLRIGYIRETALLVMTKNSVAHDTVPYFMERFDKAYTAQLQDFARNVIEGRPPSITIDDGIAAITVALAAERARQTGKPVSPAEVKS
jgi:scyllo-inositol 2-dehydrogenase (NAD+)